MKKRDFGEAVLAVIAGYLLGIYVMKPFLIFVLSVYADWLLRRHLDMRRR